MDKKYIMLITQLIQGYHMEDSELEDLGNYLNSQLKQIELRRGVK